MTVPRLLTEARKFLQCFFFPFDISKALDSVPHLALLRKLAVISVDPYIRKRVYSYLLGSEQYVVVNGANSPLLPVVNPQKVYQLLFRYLGV